LTNHLINCSIQASKNQEPASKSPDQHEPHSFLSKITISNILDKSHRKISHAIHDTQQQPQQPQKEAEKKPQNFPFIPEYHFKSIRPPTPSPCTFNNFFYSAIGQSSASPFISCGKFVVERFFCPFFGSLSCATISFSDKDGSGNWGKDEGGENFLMALRDDKISPIK
jgi:hypothetical protein